MSIIKVLAFDPAATLMGWALMEYNTQTHMVLVTAVGTIEGRKLLKHYRDMRKLFSDSFTIQTAYYHLLKEEIIPQASPDFIVSEGAFHHKFVATLVSLTLVINVIREVSRDLYQKDINIVAPMETKKILAKNHMAKKEQIRDAVITHKDIMFSDDLFPIHQMLTEHEYDAIGHGYAFIQKYLPEILAAAG